MVYQTGQSQGSLELAAYYLQNGKGTHAYRYFGVHRLVDRQGWCYVFRVAAPGADRVSLVGEWDGWEPAEMERLENGDVWEIMMCAEICPEGLRYKYLVQKGDGLHYKADPYARKSESAGEGASFICTESHYAWQDADYMKKRTQSKGEHERYAYPMNIYQVELHGWLGDQHHTAGSGTGYRAVADLLAQYAADMGYTHVLLHSPCKQNAGKDGIVTYFAPDAALGSPDDFAYFVDRMHKEHIGVLIELECRMLGTHAGGLCDFDGTCMYTERSDGYVCFDYSDPYATALLYSAATFWLREYHTDGLFINAESMACNRKTGEFLRSMASAVRRCAEDALLLLRASGYRGLSVGHEWGGLGYDLVIDGRAEAALLDCFAMSPELRVGRSAWREAASYLYQEDSILALSWSLICQRGASVLELLHGTQDEKMKGMRLLLLYMTCLPGKKMHFMGNEIGQMRALSTGEGMEWFLQELESHRTLRDFVRALNLLYLHHAALWQCDFSKEGITSVSLEGAPDGLVAFKRFDRAGREICAILNFSAQGIEQVRVAVGGRYPYYEQIFSTSCNSEHVRLQTDGQGMLTVTMEGLGGVLLSPLEPSGGFWIENV